MEELERIKLEADAREQRHLSHTSHRPLSPNYELLGLLGEQALAQFCGGMIDYTARPRGDGGIDAMLYTRHGNFPADIKTARKAYNLLVEVEKIKRRTIYILAQLEDEELGPDKMWARMLGWEWSATLRRTIPRSFGYPIVNYHIPAERLRKMHELRCFLIGGIR